MTSHTVLNSRALHHASFLVAFIFQLLLFRQTEAQTQLLFLLDRQFSVLPVGSFFRLMQRQVHLSNAFL